MKDFLFGSVYIIERDNDIKEIRRDIQNMKDFGYNLITLWPIGNAWLAKSSHEFIFSKTRQVLDICHELGIKAILQLFGQNQAQEFMPDSALTKDMMTYSEKGEDKIPNCYWANLNHPTVRDYIVRFFGEAINEFKDHPAVYGYDVFNEAHFYSDDPYTLEVYQKWLKKKYKTIEALNNAWYRRYDSFSQILIYRRRSPYSVWSSLLPDVDYEKFRSENLTDICQFLYDSAKSFDDTHAIIIDGTSSQLLYEDITMRNNDEFETAKIPDVYGSTFYPKSWGRNYKKTPWKLYMYYSMPAAAARRANKPYFVNELQTHTQSVLTPGSEVSPKELYDWILMCMFTGASGIQLWRWRPFLHGYQSTGRGMTYIDGTPNARGAITKELVDLVKDNLDIFSEFEIEKPSVKIAVSYSNRMFFDVLLKWENSFWADNVEGWYKLFWSKGIIPEFTDAENLSEEDMKSDMIVLPSMLMLSDKAKEKLSTYVENGGSLVADTRLGVFNEFGEVSKTGIPGKQLTEVFGINELDVSNGDSFVINDKKINCEFMNQLIEVKDQVKIHASMEDGTPSIVEHTYGKGNTLYFNSFIGLSFLKNIDEDVQDIIVSKLKNKMDDLKIVTKAEVVHTSVISTENKKAMLMINFSDQEQVVIISNMQDNLEILNIMTNEVIKVNGDVNISIPKEVTYILTWEI